MGSTEEEKEEEGWLWGGSTASEEPVHKRSKLAPRHHDTRAGIWYRNSEVTLQGVVLTVRLNLLHVFIRWIFNWDFYLYYGTSDRFKCVWVYTSWFCFVYKVNSPVAIITPSITNAKAKTCWAQQNDLNNDYNFICKGFSSDQLNVSL